MDHTNQKLQSNAPEPEPTSRLSPDSLLATKFLPPASSHEIIARPRLLALLNAGLHQHVILVSAAAGFGKTTLLANWVRSFPPGHLPVAWVSLDAGDNVPVQFWTYVLTALEQCHPGLSRLPFAALHETPRPSWKAMLAALINGLSRHNEHLVLVLDNYEEITDPSIQALLSSLFEHLPPTLCVVLATRTDPPFSLARLRARGQILELRTEQLRATREEMIAFLRDVMDLRLSVQNIQDVDARLQGWWAGMQLAALSLKGKALLDDLLQALQGTQSALFEYLVQEVLNRQPAQVQTFLLRTSILPRLCTSLCNAVLEQQNSQLFLEEVERANLFLSPLDEQRQWYVYHPLFAEALRARLEQTAPTEVPGLHLRASRWYAAHQARGEAIQHALQAHEWPWAAWLLEQIPSQHAWNWSENALPSRWIEQLPREVVRERPRLCLGMAQSLFWTTPPDVAESWVHDARRAWTRAHQREEQRLMAQDAHEPEAPLHLLGEIAALHGLIASFYQGDAGAARAFCQEALTHLEEQQWATQVQVTFAQARANVAQEQVPSTMQQLQAAWRWIKVEGDRALESIYCCERAWEMTIAGKLHQAWQWSQQAIHALQTIEGHQPTHLCWPYTYQARILHEWNQLEEAHHRAEQAIQLGEQAEILAILPLAYALLVRIALSQGRLEEAQKASQQLEYTWRVMSSPYRTALLSCVDQMRFWLACGDLKQARRWMSDLEQEEPLVSPLARERQHIAYVRLLLAESEPDYALKLLTSLVKRAVATQRWDHVLEMWLLQTQAYQMLQRQQDALAQLAQAVHLAAPEGYIRSFVDEGPSLAALLSQLRKQKPLAKDLPYLETLLRAFDQQPIPQPTQLEKEPSLSLQPLLDPLSAREQDVLHLLARGASNQDIAEALVVTPGTVKHHITHILSKLEATNRTQAVARAQALGLLSQGE
ncbi:LuxR C-terminal-related transcriptional regulator [Ktedonobacter racemifer]|uniref:ATP-dependent transcriptional regulator, MalT-like, LuxR family n=1 Tax=Ktedonobacter racemifer DSM 44963 TaxID=485913 RepID=D6TBZ8_KTERA|nr:LuxR C-terminal-related transcriptional regulator [Ktedonobacter racemifer]EFH88034.1 ATP-dependent transcriptional regulator, MalT-like, LuxR family [Ktedonobacter racemifer DSM 44963]